MKDQYNPISSEKQHPLYQSPVTGIVPFRASLKSHGSFGDHWHSEIEIFYLMPGSLPITVFIEEIPYFLCERDMLVVPSTAVHRIEAADKQNKVLRLDIGYPLLGENFKPFSEQRFIQPHHSLSKTDRVQFDVIESIFHAITREKLALSEEHQDNNDMDTVISRMRVSAYLIQIAALLLESIPLVPLSNTDTQKRHASQAVQSIIFYLQSHYHEPITLDRAANIAGYEKTHFCQLFKEVTGTTFHQYVTKRRLEESMHLLRDTALPIASIAQSVGIPNHKTFSRLIKQQYGMSPKEIRIQKHIGNDISQNNEEESS